MIAAPDPQARQGQPPRCLLCGRFLRRCTDAYTGEALGWRCVNVWYDGEGRWEHA